MSLSNETIRLDKWLWAARFYKTRSIARNMIDGGKVHYNGQRTKPSKTVEAGATITLRQGHEEKTIIMKGFLANAAALLKHRHCIPRLPKASTSAKKMPLNVSCTPTTQALIVGLIRNSGAILLNLNINRLNPI